MSTSNPNMPHHSSESINEMNSSDSDQLKSPVQQNDSKKLRNPFLNKLEEMLSNPDNNRLIFWNVNGSSFIIKNPTEFSETILPKYYKHNKITSFIRQLNMYGFHKKSRALRGAKNNYYQSWEFYHPKFLKDKFHLRKEIQRLSSEKNGFSSLNSDTDNSQQFSAYQTQQNEIFSQIKSLETNLAQVKSELNETNRTLVFQKKVIQNLSASLLNQKLHHTANSPLLSNCDIPSQGNNQAYSSQPAIFVTPPYDLSHNSSKPNLHNYNNNNYGYMNHPNNYMMNNSQIQIFNENQISINTSQMAGPTNERPNISISTINLQPQSQAYLNPNMVSTQQCSEASYSDDDHYRVSPASPVSPMIFQSFNYPNSQPSTTAPNNNGAYFMNPPS